MNSSKQELEQVRAELAELQFATKKSLALLAHSLAAQGNAAPVLHSLLENYTAQMDSNAQASSFDDLVSGMLKALSSLALKQHPNDPDIRDIYEGLRPGERH
jgi:hypothetical protein